MNLPDDLQLDVLNDVALLSDQGLHRNDGEPIRESFLARGSALDDFPFGAPERCEAPAAFSTHLQQPCLWIRFLVFWHFGHLITETAANIWPLLLDGRGIDLPDELVVLVPSAHRQEIPHLMRLVGRPGLRFVSTCSLEKPVRLKQVLLPRPTSVDRGAMRPSHAEVMRVFLERYERLRDGPITLAGIADGEERLQRGLRPAGASSLLDKVYLSRSLLPPTFRQLREECQLETLLLERGWSICHPEQLALRQQMQVLQRSRVLAGCSGSFFHLLLAEPLLRCSMVIVLTLDYGLEINFLNQFGLQGLHAEVVPCLAHHGDKQGSSRDVYSLLTPEELASRLDDHATAERTDWPLWRGPVTDALSRR